MLGHGEEELERSPRVVEALLGRNIVYVACGIAHTIALSGRLCDHVISVGSRDLH